MLFTTHLGADRAELFPSTVPVPAPTTTTTKPSLFAPTTSVAPKPPTSTFMPVTIVPQFGRTATGFVATNVATQGVFRALQALIELVARRKGWNVNSTWWQATPQTGTIDARTAANYLIIVNSGAPFGPLLDTRVDPLLVATQATLLANTMARWLGIPVPLPAVVAPQEGRPATGTEPRITLPTPPPPGTRPTAAPPQATAAWPAGTITANIDGRWHLAVPLPPVSEAPRMRMTGQAYVLAPAYREIPSSGVRPTSDFIRELPTARYLELIQGYAVCADGSTQPTLALCPVAPPLPAGTPPEPTALAVLPPATSVPDASPPDATLPPAVIRARYRAGCVARFNRTRKIYSIYCPVSTALGYSYVEHLAEQLLPVAAEPAPAGTVKEGEEATPPTCDTEGGGTVTCPQTSNNERDKGFFRLHNPWMWLSLVGVAGVVGGTGYVVYRRRRQG